MDKLWAVARSTFLQVMRSRVAGGFIVLTLVMMAVLPVVSQSPAKLDMLRTFVAYSLGLCSLALSILTIIVGCQLLSSEIENHHIYTPLTKPVSRPVYLLGKWLGLVLSQIVLLTIFGVSLISTAHYLRVKCEATAPGHPLSRQFYTARVKYKNTDFMGRYKNDLYNDTVERLGFSDAQKQYFREKLNACADRPQVRKAFKEVIQKYEIDLWEKKNGPVSIEAMAEIDQRVNSIVNVTISKIIVAIQTAGPNQIMKWQFEGLPKPHDTASPPQLHLKVNAQSALNHEFLRRMIYMQNPDTGISERPIERIPVGDDTYIDMPGNIITESGRLIVAIPNMPPPTAEEPISTTITVYNDDVYILYKVGTFTGNLIKAFALILILQAFLASIAMFTSSWLTFQVAMLWCAMFYTLGLSLGFITDTTVVAAGGDFFQFISQKVISAVGALLPDFKLVNPVSNMVDAVSIKWANVAKAFFDFIIVRSVTALALGGMILRSRELARVITR